MSLTVAVIIPVGPGHEEWAQQALASVQHAWSWATKRKGKRYTLFTSAEVVLVEDTEGRLGRSAARNKGMDEHPADWHFLLDADDTMTVRAFSLVQQDYAATFGMVYLNTKRKRMNRRNNIWPVTHETLFTHGANHTLNMGCFVRGDLGLRFDETLDVGEDFDFYMRLPNFIKLQDPLVVIGYDKPSAGGPRRGPVDQWQEHCMAVIDKYREEVQDDADSSTSTELEQSWR